MVRPSIKRLGERKKYINIWIHSGTSIEKILAQPLPLVLIVGLKKICFQSYALTITRRNTTQRTFLSLPKTFQKTRINLSKLRSND